MRGFVRMVGFECRKNFFTPAMLVFLGILLLINGWKLSDTYEKKVSQWSEYESQYGAFYEQYSGQITKEKLTALIDLYTPLAEKKIERKLSTAYDPDAYTYSEALDEEFYRTLFYTELRYDYLYQNAAYQIVCQAEQLSDFYQSVGNNYEAEKNAQIAADFSGRAILSFADTRGYEVLLKYDFSAMLVLLLSVFALCSMFVMERETDMYMLLQTAKYGGGCTVAAKLTATVLFVLVVCFAFFGQDFLMIYLQSDRNTALQLPIYALRYLEATGLNMKIWQYFLWSACIKIVGILGCCTIILLLSSLLRQTLYAFFASLVAVVGCAFLQEYSQGRAILRLINPMELVVCRELVQRDVFINVFDHPVRLQCFVLWGMIGMVLLEVCLMIRCNRGYRIKRERRWKA